jgi:hypothetical protein
VARHGLEVLESMERALRREFTACHPRAGIDLNQQENLITT